MKKNVALVLGSGGARGIAHIGVINELVKQGYNINFYLRHIDGRSSWRNVCHRQPEII